MLKGVSLDASILPLDVEFYLFPNGKNQYYASRFPKQSAHTGCFSKKRFRIIESDEAPKWSAEKERQEELVLSCEKDQLEFFLD